MIKIMLWLLQNEFIKIDIKNLNKIIYQYVVKNIVDKNKQIIIEVEFIEVNVIRFSIMLDDKINNSQLFRTEERIDARSFKYIKITTDKFIKTILNKLYKHVLLVVEETFDIDGFPESIENLFEEYKLN